MTFYLEGPTADGWSSHYTQSNHRLRVALQEIIALAVPNIHYFPGLFQNFIDAMTEW